MLLPASHENLDVNTLSRLFKNTTNSYKYLFFLSLLNKTNQSQSPSPRFSLGDIIESMLHHAWYPHSHFRLFFGAQDRVAKFLDTVQLPQGKKPTPADLMHAIRTEDPMGPGWKFARYVPPRLIRPFFTDELRGVPDHRADNAIAAISAEKFHERRPLYRFITTDTIQVHPDWASYLRKNHQIIHGWAERKWLDHLQELNPSTPGLAKKLAAPIERSSLQAQRLHWRRVIEETGVKCIYTGRHLSPSEFALDHFLPWSFVAHDHHWNLIPVTPSANSSKSDAIPSRHLIEPLAQAHHRALATTQKKGNAQHWCKLTESYLSDLRISEDDLLNLDALYEGYERTLTPLMAIAENMGFPRGWTPPDHSRHRDMQAPSL